MHERYNNEQLRLQPTELVGNRISRYSTWEGKDIMQEWTL